MTTRAVPSNTYAARLAAVRRFDVLVREAVVQPPDVPAFLLELELDGDR